MSEGRQPPPPSELVYVPGSSWLPVLVAAGLAGLLVGLFAGWLYAVVGAVVLLVSAWAWVRDAGDQLGRLPRRQGVTSAVLPAVPPRRPDESEPGRR
jgi:hypothetical protein